MATVATLAISLSANTTKLQKGLKKGGKLVGGFATAVGKLGGITSLVGGVGLGALVKGAIDAGDRVQKLSKQTGLSTQFLSEMRRAADLAGTDLESVATSVTRMQRSAVEAADGTATYADAFDKLGINVGEFLKLSPEEQFNTLADSLSKIDNPAEKVALGTDIMGRGFRDLIPLIEGGSAAIAAARMEGQKLGETLTQDQADKLAAVADSMGRLDGAMGAFGTKFALEFAEPLANFIDLATARLPAVTDLLKGMFNLVQGILGGGAAVIGELLSGNFGSALEAGKIVGGDISNSFETIGNAGATILFGEGLEDETSRQTRVLESMDKKLGAGLQVTAG